jgi:uncharacterized LabA/DUF88 family protein
MAEQNGITHETSAGAAAAGALAAAEWIVAPLQERRVYLAVDAENLFLAYKGKAQLNHAALIQYAASLGEPVCTALYTPRERNGGKQLPFIHSMRKLGFSQVVDRPWREQPNGKRKSDLDTYLIIDAVRAMDNGRIDLLVLVSGDSDFVPLLEMAHQLGIPTHVIAAQEVTAWELKAHSTLFLDGHQVPGLLS